MCACEETYPVLSGMALWGGHFLVEGGMSYDSRSFLVEVGVSMWEGASPSARRHVILGGGMSLCQGVCT